MTRVIYYISSHGFGHAARSIQIINQLEPDWEVTVKSAAPAWFLEMGIQRPFHLIPDVMDIGCVQINAASIDWDRTLEAYAAQEAENRARLEAECRFLRQGAFDLVLCDVPPFAVEAAHRAGVPSLVITNFTWTDIYGFVRDRHPLAPGIIDRMAQQYAQADMLLRTPFDTTMAEFPRQTRVPLIAEKGRPMRDQVCARLGVDSRKILVLIYVGYWGLEMMRWEAMAPWTNIQFITKTAPRNRPDNLVVAPQDDFRHEDLTASVDAVLAKPGYGICGECVANATPLVYMPRDEFAEFPPMENDLRRWGGAIRLAEEDFVHFRLGPALEQMERLSMDADALPTGGARACADYARNILQR